MVIVVFAVIWHVALFLLPAKASPKVQVHAYKKTVCQFISLQPCEVAAAASTRCVLYTLQVCLLFFFHSCLFFFTLYVYLTIKCIELKNCAFSNLMLARKFSVHHKKKINKKWNTIREFQNKINELETQIECYHLFYSVYYFFNLLKFRFIWRMNKRDEMKAKICNLKLSLFTESESIL
jgi:hypothetical protein